MISACLFDRVIYATSELEPTTEPVPTAKTTTTTEPSSKEVVNMHEFLGFLEFLGSRHLTRLTTEGCGTNVNISL